MSDKVQILLSSYQGEQFLQEQLTSILCQSGVDVFIRIRDDGSTDGTRNILKEYQNRYPGQICVEYGENIGAAASFFRLIEEAKTDIDYTAFADQDDFWLPEKLLRAVEKIDEEEKRAGKKIRPVLYCSDVQLVNENLEPMTKGIHYPEVRPSFGNALVENMCTGCTCVLNRELLQLVKGHIPKFSIYHDFWIYLVGSCFGRVIYDQESYILYRQHGGNVLGASGTVFENYRRRLRNFKRHRGLLPRQAAEFLKTYGGCIPKENRRLAAMVAGSKKCGRERIKLLLEKEIYRQRRSDDFIFRMLELAGML